MNIKKLIEKAIKEGKVHVVEITDEPESEWEVEVDPLAEVKEEISEIAQMNRIIYEAHINAGFTSEEALALTIATITNK